LAAPAFGSEVSVGSPSETTPQNHQNEPAVAIDANHPSFAVAGWNEFADWAPCPQADAVQFGTCADPADDGVGGSAVAFSFDSGKSWIQPTYTGWTAADCDPTSACSAHEGPILTLPWYFENRLVSFGDPAVAVGPIPVVAAGGFFDGEGSTDLEKHRTHPGHFYPVLYVPQSAEVGVAPGLLRLKSALSDLGAISGIRKDRPDETPYRRWRVVTTVKAQVTLHLLWPFIGDVKREQARAVMRTIYAQPDLTRGNPAFGVAGSRYCLRGHDKWNARVRPFRGRGRNEEDPLNHFRQCMTCVREGAQARRNKKRRP